MSTEAQSTEEAAPGAAPIPGQRLLTGKVVSNKMDKTIAVSVERLVKHPDLWQVHPPHDQTAGA